MELSYITIFFLFSFLIPLPSFAQWVQSNGPYGSRAECIASGASGVLFAGTFDGIFISNDNGGSWSRPGSGLVGEHIIGITISNDGTIIAASDGDGIFLSQNNGVNWSGASINNAYISYLMPSPSGNYFAIATNVYKSTDKGASWHLSGGSSSPITGSICADSSGNIFSIGYGNTNISTDDGETWHPVTPGIPRRYCYSLAADKAGTLFAATDSLSWRSTDHGHTWSPLPVATTSPYILQFSAAQGKIYGATTWEFYQSSDGGNTWSLSSNEGGQPTDILSTGNNTIFISTGSGIIRSTDGGNNWLASVNGMTNTSIGPIVAKASGDVFASVAGLLVGVFHSSDNGKNWVDANLRSGSYYPVSSLAMLHSGTVLAGTRGSGLFRTSNNAANWKPVGDLPDSNILSLSVTKDDGLLVGTVSQGVFFSSDSGDHWIKISQSIPDMNIQAIAVDSSGNYIIGTSQKNVFRSTDQGAHWTNISGGALTGFLRSIVVNKAGVIFIGAYNQGIIKTTNNGAKWDHLASGLPDSAISSLTLDDDTLYATFSDSGIYRSTNEGLNWQPMNSGLVDRDVNSIVISPNGYLFAGTFGDGVYRSGTLKAGVPENQNQSYIKAITYPNPATDLVHIKYTIAKPTQSIIRIYNSLGKQEYQKNLGEIGAGDNEIIFDSSKLPNGLYSYSIASGANLITGEMIVIH